MYLTIYLSILLDVTPGDEGLLDGEGTTRRSDRQGEGDIPRDKGRLPVLNINVFIKQGKNVINQKMSLVIAYKALFLLILNIFFPIKMSLLAIL